MCNIYKLPENNNEKNDTKPICMGLKIYNSLSFNQSSFLLDSLRVIQGKEMALMLASPFIEEIDFLKTSIFLGTDALGFCTHLVI